MLSTLPIAWGLSQPKQIPDRFFGFRYDFGRRSQVRLVFLASQ